MCQFIEVNMPMDEMTCRSKNEASHRIERPLKSSLRHSCDSKSIDSSSSSCSVEFATTEIHYFGPSLGCNPSVHGGPPLELGNHISSKVYDIYKYENRKSAAGDRRSASELYMDKETRRALLCKSHAMSEIWDCEREMIVIQKQRTDSIRQDLTVRSLTNFFGVADDEF